MSEDNPDDPPIGEPAAVEDESFGDLVTIGTYILLKDAFDARLRLEGEEIECVLLDENIAGINPFYAVAGGGMRLQVRESDAARAREILAPETPPAAAPLACPECGSTETWPQAHRQGRFGSIFWFCIVLAFTIFPLPRHPRRRCGKCGHIWKQH